MKKKIIAGISIVAFALLLAGCGSKTVTKAPGGGKVTVEKGVTGQVKDVKVETKEGSYTAKVGSGKSISEAELGAPVYPGAAEAMAADYGSKMANQPGYSQHVLTTRDSFDKVDAFYKSHLKDVMTHPNMSGGQKKIAMYMSKTGDMMVQVIEETDKKQTLIQVMKKK